MRRYPKGISKRPEGWRISVAVNGKIQQRSFKPSTPQADVEAELLKARQRWAAGRGPTPGPGTFAADIDRYLRDYFAGHPGLEERRRHLALWLEVLGTSAARAALTRDDIARALNGWRSSGLAADTCNKRRTALLALYHALDGRGGSNPVREIPKFRAPDPLPRGLAYDLIQKALEKLPACKTRARLTVLAYTGIRAGQLMKLTPDHWDHRQHVLTVPGTTKGRGTKPYVVPLSRQAQDALKVFDALDAWGPFTWAPMARMWREAWFAMTTKQPRTREMPIPAAFVSPVPYDLRHSFGTAIYQASGDLHAARKLLGHSSIRMTDRYTLAAVPQQQRAAVAAFGAKIATQLAKRQKRARKR